MQPLNTTEMEQLTEHVMDCATKALRDAVTKAVCRACDALHEAGDEDGPDAVARVVVSIKYNGGDWDIEAKPSSERKKVDKGETVTVTFNPKQPGLFDGQEA